MKKRLFSFTMLAMSILAMASCGGKEEDPKDDPTTPVDPAKTYYSNEENPIIFSSQELDKVFNPFFSTNAADGNVVGMTQIGMLGNDKNGKVTYGEDEPVVVLDYETITTGTADVDQITTYNFVLKNNVKFSNGSPLTIKDVLFNLYVYLDPVYTGSSTIYSTDIVGLKEYRTQESSENEQDSFKEQFEVIAETRIEYLLQAADYIFEDNKETTLSATQFKEKLNQYVSQEGYENVVKDYEKALELFKEELNTDYTNAMDSYSDITFTSESGQTFKNLFTTDVEAFLYNEGYISFNKKEGKLESALTRNPSELKSWTKENAINTIINDKIPNDIAEIVSYWNTGIYLTDYLVNEAIEEHFQNITERTFPNISGITFANKDTDVTVNGKNYASPEYNADGTISNNTNEVLSIKIHNIDPKAIWNFAFSVAPMYYYSDAEHIEKFDFVSNFGVEYSSQTFMNEVIKNPSKIGIPVGAGPYQASKASGGTENVTAGDFYDKGVVYFERNEHYLMGAPKIKKLRLQVVSQNRMLDALYNNEIDFVEPNAKPETISELNSKKDSGIGNKSIQTSGYGYIGINAGKVPDLKVRQAIMHSIDTSECVNYYKNTAQAIYRSMSKSSWAYPKGSTAYYPYIGGSVPTDLSVVNPDYKDYIIKLGKASGDKLSEAEQLNFIRELVEGCGYVLGGNGVYAKGNHTLKYTFTIAGEETDHPAWQAMYHAGEVLNKVGFQINVTTDANALKKLSSGALTVWAAAWGSTIDPDMYQVYHKDSNATSVLNWGYKQIKQNNGGKYDTELSLVEELSDLIDLGRKTNDETKRARIYSEALDIVMQLAIELPTYQRDDLFAYNTNKIDESTLTPESDLSPYNGLTSDLWTISLNEER